jgi:rRNA maturation endonuclease Nob1
MAKLTKLQGQKKNEILFTGDLGHYIADGHMCILLTIMMVKTPIKKEFTLKVVCQSCLQNYKFNVPHVYLEMILG